jgi:hypothetical protein
MRDFLHSEIAAIHGISNVPDDPDLASPDASCTESRSVLPKFLGGRVGPQVNMVFKSVPKSTHYCHGLVRKSVEIVDHNERILAMSNGIAPLQKDKVNESGLVGENLGWHAAYDANVAKHFEAQISFCVHEVIVRSRKSVFCGIQDFIY